MKLSKLSALFFYLVLFTSQAQYNEPEQLEVENSTDDAYLFPIEPGTQGLLAGTMGELRSNHFHSGIDVRTSNRIGVPVQAAQRGYVSRVVVSPVGFGNAVYVKHPNGQTTVYGHLDRFDPAIAEYVRQQQYNKKSFEVDLYFKSSQFPVQRGDIIAFSGNSGGSSGPHLHFDIRDVNNEALNPLQFHFDEIVDHIAPNVEKVALTTMDIDSRINDQFGRFEFYVVKNGDRYELPQPVLACGRIGIEILAYDRMDDSRAKCGINYIEMNRDDQTIFRQTIDRINFGETRNVLALMDYKTLRLKGLRYNKLYIDDGNDLPYYKGTVNQGIIHIDAPEVPIQIKLKDTYGNESELRLKFKANPKSSESGILRHSGNIQSDVQQNTLKITSGRGDQAIDSLWVMSKNNLWKMLPAYTSQSAAVYLIDLRKVLPDSVWINGESLAFHFKDQVPSGSEYKYYADHVDISFGKNTLYDTTFLAVDYQGDDRINIGDPLVPLQRSISVTLKPSANVTEAAAVYGVSGNSYSYVGGAWSNGKIKFTTREFGTYALLQDSVPPSITKLNVNRYGARFKVRDYLSGISYVEANINGEWLLMNYDAKSNTIWSETLDPKSPLIGDLTLKVVDHAGNESIFQQKIL